jgi:carotenoid cleavage dioxygenase-like enzyme
MQLSAPPCAAARGRSRRRVTALAVATPQRAPPAQQQSTPAWAARFAHNPALAGNFAPVANEVFLPSLRVEGVLPASLDGVFLRNGPNPRFPPDLGGGYHWFGARGAHQRVG